MTTYFQLVPSNRRAPSFMPILDGKPCTVTVLWNISAQRYYVNCQDSSGNLVFMLPLIENYDPFPIESLEYDEQNQRVIVTLSPPEHLIPIGTVISANVINCSPAQYNGQGFLTILNSTQIYYPMATNPGPATVLGAVDYLISMTRGYFASTMIFRNNTFEVNP